MVGIKVGQVERKTQNRVVELFKNVLNYQYLGNWQDREDNSNVEVDLLKQYLNGKYSDVLIQKAVNEFKKACMLPAGSNFFEVNKAVYSLLRYGVKVKETVDSNPQTVYLINWDEPEKNNFAVAEEVTVYGQAEKRPDLVLYINGIAVGVIELKRSVVSVSEGIQQNIGNQRPEYIQNFFTTMQLLMAGNDTEGLRYATTETPEKYWLEWKEENATGLDTYGKLDRQIIQLCNKNRIIDIIHNFIIFDAGIKKTCRHNQYFGVKAAQKRIAENKGGVIWHTQGSGKSLTMVWLAKWILEHDSDARVLVITDRTELDEQIELVFNGVDEEIWRAPNSRRLFEELNITDKRLLCSLVHKFGRVSNTNGNPEYHIDINEIRKTLPSNFLPKGKIYVFVDECHRSHSGKLHDAMKELLGDSTIFVGFTGTPLLRKDKHNSFVVWGSLIHSYKYDQAVKDGVVLDLRYEARAVEQDISSQEKIDEWFDRKTANLTETAKVELKKRWGTMQNLMSSKTRMEKIVIDIEADFETKPRLQSGRGNAMLVASSIYEACQYYKMFQDRGYLTKCAVITSYEPGALDTASSEYQIYTKMLNGKSTKDFEDNAKKMFRKYPGQMQLLIVVDKLLTGFDAPSATYLYIDKNMQDHGLFQAVCRVNRLDYKDEKDSEIGSILNKDYGYIIDYRDLFKKLEKSVTDYTGNAFEGFDKDDVVGLLKDKIEQGKEDLENALESVEALCEPVAAPRGLSEYIQYFCGDTESVYALKETEQKRLELYKVVSSLCRKYEALAGDMKTAGYTKKEAERIKDRVKHFQVMSQEIKMASGDWIDLKKYDKDMRNLFDQYVLAKDSEVLNNFDNKALLQLIENAKDDEVDEIVQASAAETIENNVRRMISDNQQTNPKYYEKMSALLTELVKKRKQKDIEYREYLEQIEALAKRAGNPVEDNVPGIDTKGKKALYDFFDEDKEKALKVYTAIKNTAQADWRGNPMKRRTVKKAISDSCGIMSGEQLDKLFDLVVQNVEF